MDQKDDQRTDQEKIDDCKQFRKEMQSILKSNNWDLVDDKLCRLDSCSLCNGRFREYILMGIMLYCKEITPKIEETINRIYGCKTILTCKDKKLTSEGWFEVIYCTIPDFNQLSYFSKNKLFDPNYGSHQYTLLSLYASHRSITNKFDKKYLEYILSPEVGFNINIQNADGKNILISILDDMNTDQDIDEYQEVYDYIEMIIYLLDKGADPLLEDKDGMCALDYIKGVDYLVNIGSKKNQLIDIIESYQ